MGSTRRTQGSAMRASHLDLRGRQQAIKFPSTPQPSDLRSQWLHASAQAFHRAKRLTCLVTVQCQREAFPRQPEQLLGACAGTNNQCLGS
jgi:hypothetical protein